ncbi:MAG: hypothetical protein ACTSRP_05140 [Candidatus Helarchaeota archaeon]
MESYSVSKNLKKFIEFMEEIEEFRKKDNYKEVIDRLEELNKYIESIKEESIEEIKKYLDNSKDIEKIENAIETFFDEFFDCFNTETESFKYLFKECLQIYRERIYQLNHTFGYIMRKLKTDLKENKIFQLYIYSMLYLDYYESFAIFIEPFLKKRFEKNRKKDVKFKIYSNNAYKFLFPIYFGNVLFNSGRFKDFKDIDWFFDYKLRNAIAHSNYLIDPNNNCLKNFKNINTENLMNIKEKYEVLRNFIIIFTTKFDLEINKRFNNNKNVQEYWSVYFEKYFMSWKKFFEYKMNANN